MCACRKFRKAIKIKILLLYEKKYTYGLKYFVYFVEPVESNTSAGTKSRMHKIEGGSDPTNCPFLYERPVNWD